MNELHKWHFYYYLIFDGIEFILKTVYFLLSFLFPCIFQKNKLTAVKK